MTRREEQRALAQSLGKKFAQARQRDPMLNAALELARDGWPVFPCNGEIPHTANGFLDATTDETQIRLMWGTWKGTNIGGAGILQTLVRMHVSRSRHDNVNDRCTFVPGPRTVQ